MSLYTLFPKWSTYVIISHSRRRTIGLPTGTVTFLFTDIEGSTRLALEHPDQWEASRARHHAILHSVCETNHGFVFQIIGDAFYVAFHTVKDGLAAAIESQQELQTEEWDATPIKVRMGLHTGSAERKGNDYRGYLTLAKVQRVMSVAYGGQILLSNASAELLHGEPLGRITLRDLKEHWLKGLPEPEHLWQAVAPDLQKDFPPLQSLKEIPHNLPVQLTTFIGREKEVEQIKKGLGKSRLVTLTGSGGTGKTRLLLQVASELLDHFKDGVWFIELAPIIDPDLVPNSVASVLGVREEPSHPLMTRLMDWFSDRELLIILDNCEHLLEACARFSDSVLRGSRTTRILASSREALGITGETAYRVPSLPTPDPKEQLNLEQLQKCESVQLFIERATQILPAFKVTQANSPAITQICHRLDGIPLAIELAAARVKVLSVEQIAERLDDRFRLLTGGSRTALPRQQTLRALIDWSYQLLSEQECLLFRRLAVFVGGWTLEAAEAVCSDREGGIGSGDILDLLSHLVDKSLVIVENNGKESRYHRLETIRQYAREKLFETAEVSRICDKHLDYLLNLAEQSETEMLFSNQVEWLKRLDDEFDNIRAGLEWSKQNRVEHGLRLGSAIWRFCLRYGYTNEIVDKLDELLKFPPAARRTSVRAKTLCVLSILAVWKGDLKKLRPLAEESVAIYQELEDQHGLAASLYALGVAANHLDDPESLSLLLQSLDLYRSINDRTDICDVLIVISQVSNDPTQRQACLQEALALARERGDAITMAGALDNLGILAKDLGNFSQARSWLEESLNLQRPLGAPGYVTTLQYLGEVTMYEGNFAEARTYFEEVISKSKNAGLTANLLWSLAGLGDTALREGKWDETRAIFVEILRRSRSLGRTDRGMIYAVEALASVAAHENHPDRAARLFAFVTTMRKARNAPPRPRDQPIIDRELAFAKTQLDDSTFEVLWAEGEGLTLEGAVELALEENDEPIF